MPNPSDAKMHGKVIMVTGGTSGIGAVVVQALDERAVRAHRRGRRVDREDAELGRQADGLRTVVVDQQAAGQVRGGLAERLERLLARHGLDDGVAEVLQHGRGVQEHQPVIVHHEHAHRLVRGLRLGGFQRRGGGGRPGEGESGGAGAVSEGRRELGPASRFSVDARVCSSNSRAARRFGEIIMFLDSGRGGATSSSSVLIASTI